MVNFSVKYDILDMICVANWVPTNHSSSITPTLAKLIFHIGTKSKLNFGEYVFNQTMKHANSFDVNLPKKNSCLITGIILKQHPEVLHPQETPIKKARPLTLENKLFVRTHVPYIVVKHQSKNPSENSSSVSKATKKEVLHGLMEVSKAQQATLITSTTRKNKVDELIDLMTNEKEGEDEEEFDSEKE